MKDKDKILTPFTLVSNLLNKGHDRSIKAKKNIVASVFIKGTGMAVSLLLVPLTIKYINVSQYGIWLTLSSIVGWFSFFLILVLPKGYVINLQQQKQLAMTILPRFM